MYLLGRTRNHYYCREWNKNPILNKYVDDEMRLMRVYLLLLFVHAIAFRRVNIFITSRASFLRHTISYQYNTMVV